MLTREESKILAYLSQHPTSLLAHVLRECLPGAPAEWGNRVIADLEWLGYVTVFCSDLGTPVTLEITPKGMNSIKPRRAVTAPSGA